MSTLSLAQSLTSTKMPLADTLDIHWHEPHKASFTHSLIRSYPIRILTSSRNRFVPLPYINQRRLFSRSSQSITFIVRRGRARHNDNAVVTTDSFAKCMALGVATGTGDHAAVEICVEGLRKHDSW